MLFSKLLVRLRILNRDESIHLLKMGCSLRFLRFAAFRLCSHLLFCFSVRAVVGVDLHGPDLLGQRFMEHQWGIS